ncbi:N-glycosylation protein-domain-containing protein [Cytidiella melzeri]|nr:N-glycosylation protein-domain-containing protein [Cytidiella melzeri]
MTVLLPSLESTHRQRAILDLAPLLFESCRLLSVVPAVFGTLWNFYRALRPPKNDWGWSVDYIVCILWSVLTGWQCLQLTTGLLKRWRVYYSPLPTLIRLLALQAICWPATHFTLTLLDHEARPLICWTAIGTTTCCSRSIQMWVTSNIVEPPGSSSDANMKRRSKRKWNGPAVLRECVLPAGIAYFVTVWVLMLSKELGGFSSS